MNSSCRVLIAITQFVYNIPVSIQGVSQAIRTDYRRRKSGDSVRAEHIESVIDVTAMRHNCSLYMPDLPRTSDFPHFAIRRIVLLSMYTYFIYLAIACISGVVSDLYKFCVTKSNTTCVHVLDQVRNEVCCQENRLMGRDVFYDNCYCLRASGALLFAWHCPYGLQAIHVALT